MFGEPPATRLDVHFRLSGIPVRVHPMFWVIAFLLGWNLPVVEQLLWVGVVFISVLVHELGHTSSALLFGKRSRIVLYSIGGLTISEPDVAPLRGWRHALVATSGPAAGFVLAIAAYLALPMVGTTSSGVNGALYFHLVRVNVAWGVVNLLPIFPLDGGQMMRSLLTELGGDLGHAWASGVSLLTTVVVGVGGWWVGRPLIALLAAYFFYREWQGSL